VNIFSLSTRLGSADVNKIELKSLLTDQALGTPAGRIVRTLSERGSLSAAQLARLTGLAKSTVSTALSELRRADMVVEVGSDSGGSVGRPATSLTLNPRAGTCIGILVGQTEIQVIVADVSHSVLSDHSVSLDPDYPPEQAQDLVRKMIAEAYAGQWHSPAGLLGVGIALGGPVNPLNGQVLRGGLPRWVGRDVRAMFGPMFDAPLFFDNESNCAAIAEMTWGAAQGHDDFILLTLDLGVGGAIVSGGKVMRGIAGGAGEFGHVVIDPEGPACRCGNRGCLEVYANFRPYLAEAEARFGEPLRVNDVVRRALDGDAACRALIARAGEAGGRGLGLIGSVFNPSLVVIGGRLAMSGDMLMSPLAESFERYSLIKREDVPEEAQTTLRRSHFSENGACMGAVGLVLRHRRHETAMHLN
jgi:predicted NBD/HSP70 family sugar kinase